MRNAILGAVVALGVVLAACGGAGDKSSSPTSDPNALSDEAYLKVFCTGLTEYREALLTKTTADDIAKVIKDYIAALKPLSPPQDIAKFHQEYVKYLEDAVNDPTSLVTRNPPEPGASERQRLASKTSNVPECKYPTFLADQTPDAG
jgi:hypothetical protein